MITKKLGYYYIGGTTSKILRNNIIGFVILVSLVCVSCSGNPIHINPETLTVFSEHVSLSSLIIEITDDKSKCDYEIFYTRKEKGPQFIKLDSIPKYYTIEEYLNGYKKNDMFKPELSNHNQTYNLIRRNCHYIVTNSSVGDAAAISISFDTDSVGHIIEKTVIENYYEQ